MSRPDEDRRQPPESDVVVVGERRSKRATILVAQTAEGSVIGVVMAVTIGAFRVLLAAANTV